MTSAGSASRCYDTAGLPDGCCAAGIGGLHERPPAAGAPAAGLDHGAVLRTSRVPGRSIQRSRVAVSSARRRRQRARPRQHRLRRGDQQLDHRHRVDPAAGARRPRRTARTGSPSAPSRPDRPVAATTSSRDRGQRAEPLPTIEGRGQRGQPIPGHRRLVEPAVRGQPMQPVRAARPGPRPIGRRPVRRSDRPGRRRPRSSSGPAHGAPHRPSSASAQGLPSGSMPADPGGAAAGSAPRPAAPRPPPARPAREVNGPRQAGGLSRRLRARSTAAGTPRRSVPPSTPPPGRRDRRLYGGWCAAISRCSRMCASSACAHSTWSTRSARSPSG